MRAIPKILHEWCPVLAPRALRYPSIISRLIIVCVRLAAGNATSLIEDHLVNRLNLAYRPTRLQIVVL